MSARDTARRPLQLAAALGALTWLAGCGQTLVFGERDGVNFAIRADAKTQPPLEVNFGLNRTVGTVIPPAGQIDGHPEGEAVNMVAGFQIDRSGEITPTRPFGVGLRIATQFASGAAAEQVAGSPSLVKQIVNVTGQPNSQPTPDPIRRQVRTYSIALAGLSPPQKRKLALDLGLLAPSEAAPPAQVDRLLRLQLSHAAESPELFAQFKQMFDRSTGS